MKTFMGILAVVAVLNLFSTLANASATSKNLPRCTLASEGIVVNSWVQHRILVDEQPIFGANDMATITKHLEQLRNQGVCR